MAVGKNITWKKGKQYDIETFGMNINLGKGKGTEIMIK